MLEELQLGKDWWEKNSKDFEDRGHTPKEIAFLAYCDGYRKAEREAKKGQETTPDLATQCKRGQELGSRSDMFNKDGNQIW